MMIGSWCVERHEMRVPWLVVSYERPARTVIWGGSPVRDVWVGSAADRSRERFRRGRAALVRMGLVLSSSFAPAAARATRSLRELSAAVEASREW